jgi:hypothetical protein
LDVVVPRNRPLELVRAYRVAARAYRRLGDTAAALGLLQRAAEL